MSTRNHRPARRATLGHGPGGPPACYAHAPRGETHLVEMGQRTLLARAERFGGGSYPAGFVLAKAPAHASGDELLQLAADRDAPVAPRVDPGRPTPGVPQWPSGQKQIAASVELTAEKWFV